MIEKEVEKMLDENMQKGYSHLKKNNYILACEEWGKVWRAIIDLMDNYNYESIEAFEEDFHGLQCIYNWAADYEAELGNAATEDIKYAQIRINYCGEFINRYSDKNDTNISGMKRAIAESYFRLGKRDEGETIFKNYLEEDPTWGWGWISWSDEYWIFAKEENKDSVKAVSILKQALEIENLEDRTDVLERLKDIYEELGMKKEANEIVINRDLPGIPLSEIGNFAKFAKAECEKFMEDNFQNAIKSVKVGRNEPCPCRSGKKYKKCCGR